MGNFSTAFPITNRLPSPTSCLTTTRPSVLSLDQSRKRLMPNLLYFCELLLNVKQVSVSIDNQDAAGQQRPTSVSLHPSRRALTIAFGAQASHVILPAPVDHISTPLAPCATYRLPASQSLSSSGSLESRTESPSVPWEASTLPEKTSIHCATCATRITPSLRIQKWKNLPSEAWADLMDLWHCHKPHDEKGQSEGGKYAGVGRITADKAVGLIDPMYFLLCKDDCENIYEQSTGTNEAETILCRGCAAPLGIVDAKSDGIRLMKWSLALGFAHPHDNDGELESYTMLQWLSAQLLFLVDNTGQRKFVVKPGASILTQQYLDGSARRVEEANEGVHVWVFNPSTLITRTDKPTATRAMRIYYQTLMSRSDMEQLGDLESVYLPFAVYTRFKESLAAANDSLPRDLKTWGDWRGGWLERF
ncbi:hypothetical protein DRE_04770 [Drechslerella stenobrocha 248]|uniref:Ubiquitin-conjugating enzyme E2-binding protein n=1 Tax=Drechslerella stenobrocha 248 TaxID=1043628 RepID=W7I0I2_9PEZI|nr:hypothetical protein DRE_04770 [Drechslerella stenobrocha 248]